jgi:hypothetical protein
VSLQLIDRSLLTFWLYDWLDLDAFLGKHRFREHSRETDEAALDAAEQLARTAPRETRSGRSDGNDAYD